jgi:hypothetical protein
MPYGPGTYGTQRGRPPKTSPLKETIKKRLPKPTMRYTKKGK